MRQRVTQAEMLDGEVDGLPTLAESLREVWGVNRWLGGLSGLRRRLAAMLPDGPCTLLDVAGGTGDVAVAIADWATGRGVPLSAVVLDNHPQVLALARERTARLSYLQVVEGDARALPFRDGAFDLAICNLALHHFPTEDAGAVLRELHRVSRRGWVVSDLERHPLAYLAARGMARVVWRSPITRHDGPLSVARSFTADEARALVRQAGVPAQVHRRAPFRLEIVGVRV